MLAKSLVEAAFPPKNILDDFRPAVAHPETAKDWKENCDWLAYWLTPVFKSVVKVESDYHLYPNPILPRSDSRQRYARMQLDAIIVRQDSVRLCRDPTWDGTTHLCVCTIRR